MASLVQQSTTQLALKFLMVLTSDHITGATALTPTVTIRKEGGTFITPTGAVTEIANGWYQVAANATDTNTLGEILLHATAATADPSDGVVAMVVAFNPQTANLGLTNVSANVAQWNGSAVATPATAGIPDVNAKNINNVATTSVTTINANVGTTQPTNFTGTGASALVKSDTVDIAGAAVSTTSAQVGVNVVNVAGAAAALDANNFIKVGVEAINANTTAAVNLGKSAADMGRGTCTTGGTTTSIPTSAFTPGGAGIVSGQFIGRTIIFDGATATAALQGQATNITANTSGATPTFTVTALTTAPSSGDTFSVV